MSSDLIYSQIYLENGFTRVSVEMRVADTHGCTGRFSTTGLFCWGCYTCSVMLYELQRCMWSVSLVKDLLAMSAPQTIVVLHGR